MSDPIEQAVRKAIYELEHLVSKYTIAHPENTMRVLGLLWADQRRIADYLRRSLDAYVVAGPATRTGSALPADATEHLTHSPTGSKGGPHE